MILIRPETEADIAAIFAINEAAFGRKGEAKLVDDLRDAGRLAISLVAHDDGTIVGHIAFSAVRLETARPSYAAVLGLAPMAVRPDRQRQGIGSRLVMKGIHAAREAGAGALVVLGHPEFYPKFGFQSASRFGVKSVYKVPNNTFMALEIKPQTLPKGALVRYDPLFDGLD